LIIAKHKLENKENLSTKNTTLQEAHKLTAYLNSRKDDKDQCLFHNCYLIITMPRPDDKDNLSTKNTALQEAHKSTSYSSLYEDIEECPVPDRYHKLSSR